MATDKWPSGNKCSEPDLKRPIRILLVDNFAPFRRLVRSILTKQPALQVIGEVPDGLGAIQKAEELQPDLVLLDLDLPLMNGFEATRQIRQISAASKLLFVCEDRAFEIAREALRLGAGGYVLKSDVVAELLPAIEAVLQGKRFISADLSGRTFAARHQELY